MKVTRKTRWEDLPEILTPEELADWFGQSLNTAYDVLRRGCIPQAVRLGRKWLIPKNGLLELFRGCEEQNAAEDQSAAKKGGRDGSATSLG